MQGGEEEKYLNEKVNRIQEICVKAEQRQSAKQS